ncbi:ABC transporter substrate-binding protein [Blastococcus saxobsidens]|uniref:ABC-type nitrate/sulfonate/bicarbonate transport system substrate-binding protein n=1 Tax=Blastococcus saxobsidens TaxID=138336 RepID=A0A4Q7Y8S7_9ACTN|nr:ABC transporter substrate-binding protein [Blastococcus saxobsidens]RZU32425.1 ABC-type nitrate/sulfonate/bicarbonate transport system substrate-binding protein [Blastococcus saxobsidens]
MKSSTYACTALTATAVLLLSACGGSEGGGLSDAPDSGNTPAAAGGGECGGDGLTALTMAETPGGPLSFVAYGVQQGNFEEEGIDLTVTPSPGGGTTSVPALLQGEYDVMGLDLVSAITSIEAGLPLKMVSGGSSTSDEPEGDFSGVLVKPDSPIQSREDLEGVRMGVNALGNVNELAINDIIEENGSAEGAISPVELPFPEIVAAIGRGDVDAGILIEPFVTIAENQGLRVVDRPWVGIKPGLQIGTMIMTEEKIDECPEVADNFAAAVQATADDIREDPEAFRAALPALIDLDPALAEEINLIQWRGASDMESIELTGQLMAEYGLIDEEIDYEDAVIN